MCYLLKKSEKKPAAPKIVTVKEDIKADIEVKDMVGLSKDKVKEAKKRWAHCWRPELLIAPMGIFSWEIWVPLPEESQLRQSRATQH